MSEALKRTLSTDNERKYQLISKATIRLFAESRGHTLSEEVLRVLSEDVNYRLREIVWESMLYMKHSPAQTLLTVDDVRRALADANVFICTEPSFADEDPLQYFKIPSLKISVPNDVAVDLQEMITSDTPAASVTSLTYESCTLEPSHVSQKFDQEMSKCISDYFSAITEAAVGGDPSLRKVALLDVITSPKIGHVHHQMLAFIQRWVDAGVKAHTPVYLALELLDALTNNDSVNFATQSQLAIITKTLVSSVCLNSSQANLTKQLADQVYASNILNKCLRFDTRICHRTKLSVISVCEETLHDDCSDADSVRRAAGALLVITTLDPTALLRVKADISSLLLDEESALGDRLTIYSILLDGVDRLLGMLNALSMTRAEQKNLLNYCNFIYTQSPDQAVGRLHKNIPLTIASSCLWRSRQYLRKVLAGRICRNTHCAKTPDLYFDEYKLISKSKQIRVLYGRAMSTRNNNTTAPTNRTIGTTKPAISCDKLQSISIVWQSVVHSRTAKLQAYNLYSVQSDLSVML